MNFSDGTMKRCCSRSSTARLRTAATTSSGSRPHPPHAGDSPVRESHDERAVEAAGFSASAYCAHVGVEWPDRCLDSRRNGSAGGSVMGARGAAAAQRRKAKACCQYRAHLWQIDHSLASGPICLSPCACACTCAGGRAVEGRSKFLSFETTSIMRVTVLKVFARNVYLGAHRSLRCVLGT